MAAKTVQVRFWLLSVFLPIFDFSIWSFLNYSMYCWLVWTEKGHKLFCWDWLLACLPCFDFDSFICRWCLLKYVTSCLNLINALFMFKSYSLLSPYPAHGLTYEMELSMLIYIFCSSFLCIYVFFLSMFYVSFLVRCSSLCVLGACFKRMTKVLAQGMRCAAILVYSGVFLWVDDEDWVALEFSQSFNCSRHR